MKRFFFCCLFSTACCLLSTCLFSQRNNFQTYSLEQGLPQATIYCIIQDTRGYLWLGTDGGGLCRFDGINFKTFSKKEGFSGDAIRCLLQDSKGRIWAGTEDEGIIIYDGLSFRNIANKNGLAGSNVLSLHEDKNGNILAGTDDGGLNKITEFTKDSFHVQVIDESKGLSSNSIFGIHEDKNGRIWLATLGGGVNIITFLKDTFQIDWMKVGEGIPTDNLLSVKEDNYGALWLGTYDKGVFRIDLPKKENIRSKNFMLDILSRHISEFNASNGFNGKTIWNILLSGKKDLWFASSEDGILRCHIAPTSSDAPSEKIVFDRYTQAEGLPNNQMLCFYEDNEGNIWIGTNGGGLCKFMGDKFSHFSKKDGLSAVYGMDQDSLGNVWLGTADGLVQMQVSQHIPVFKTYSTKEGLSGNSILSVSVGKTAHNNNIWAAVSNAGISKFNGKKFTNFYESKDLFDNALIDNFVYSILVDDKGIVWCGTKSGISRYSGANFLNMNIDKLGFRKKDVNTVIMDRENNIWFGTSSGLVLSRYGDDELNFTTYDEVEGLLHKEIKALAVGPDNNIWIGTNNGGIYLFNKHIRDTIKIHQVINDSLIGFKNITSLIFQDEKNLIVGTKKGFDKITFDYNGSILKIRNYNASDGFIGVECNDNAIYKDKKGNIWFGTLAGLTRYNPADENTTHTPPQTHITSIKLFYKEVDWSKRSDSLVPWFNLPHKLELPYSDNHLIFQFSSISMENPQKLRFRYMLEGLEEDWSPATTQTERDYSGLAPGTYTFKVKAAGAPDIWSDPATFKFTINPPWYRTIWFYSLCAATIILIIYFYIKIRERALILEKKILENKVVERTAEVVKQKDELEHQNKIIEEKNKDITDSINYAERIQRAILPEPERIHAALPESFILFRPKDIVSGDFYWFAEIPQDKKKHPLILIAAADCTGHGVPGAFMSMVNTSLLNEAVRAKKIINPGEILDDVRQGIIRALRQKGETGEQKDGMDIGVVRLEMNGGKSVHAQYAGANNSLYLIRKSDHPVIEEIDPDPMPVAISDRMQKFSNHDIDLQEGDTMYIFTDGYADQFGGPKGKKFKYAQFKQLLLSIQNKPMDEQKQILDKTMEQWKGSLEQIDDILVIGVRV